MVQVKRAALVAIDLGAESCRVSLLRHHERGQEMALVHRFPNGTSEDSGRLRWDLAGIYRGIERGLRKCGEIAAEGISSIGVDGWAVDYVRLGDDGLPLANPYCYRDERTVRSVEEVHRRISAERLYELTGIQILRLNTVYQLYADSWDGIDQGLRWINLPEYVSYRLGGRPVSEYTNATHTALVRLGRQQWSDEVFAATGLRSAAAPPIVPTGAIIGRFTGLPGMTAFHDTHVIVPACHDTASAIAGIAAEGDDWAFISSGTWSLVGTLLDSPCVTSEARNKNFTNLGMAGNRIGFLKNVNGMWLLRQCMETWEDGGRRWAVEDLLRECEQCPAPDHLFDVDEADLLLPGKMPQKINAQREAAGFPPLPEGNSGAPLMASAILHSLAQRYAEVLRDIAQITGKKLRRLYVVGGGSKNKLLNRLTAEATGLEVMCGPAESSTVGNFAVQAAALDGDYSDSTGVSGAAVAKWAGVLGSEAVAQVRSESIRESW